MIRHSVIFKFKSEISNSEKSSFFEATQKLSLIPGVQHVEIVKQVSPKNDFEFGILMAFENVSIFQAYNIHPDHDLFIQQYWLKMVDSFLEIDYAPMLSE